MSESWAWYFLLLMKILVSLWVWSIVMVYLVNEYSKQNAFFILKAWRGIDKVYCLIISSVCGILYILCIQSHESRLPCLLYFCWTLCAKPCIVQRVKREELANERVIPEFGFGCEPILLNVVCLIKTSNPHEPLLFAFISTLA